MNYYIITGASRGLGEAIVQELFDTNHVIYYVARTKNQALEELAASNHIPLYFEKCDLSEVNQVGSVMKRIFSKIELKQAKKITLINNAGMVDPIKNVGHADAEDIIANVHVNFLAPVLLCEYFIKETKEFIGQAVIVNITSGAANRTTAGWSLYGSTKAGVNMFTKTIGFEQKEHEHKVIAIAFSPGIMDTAMQRTIRTASKEDFSSIEQFKEYHEKGLLRAPGYVAKVLVDLLAAPLENGRIYDIKEWI